jgi:hypothetical protein
MKVFISWSGERSKAVAKILREWLPSVLVTVEPWMSEEDIEKGQRWSAEIATRLAECKVGIVCVTSDNASRPWLCFEAGAISKTLSETYVCPVLLDLGPSDITGPLAQFQATAVSKADVRRLLETINRAVDATGERAFNEAQMEKAFERAWPELDVEIRKVPPSANAPKQHRSERELLAEVLDLVRQIARRTVEPYDYLAAGRFLPLTRKALAELHWPTSLAGDAATPQARILEALIAAQRRLEVVGEDSPESNDEPRGDDDRPLDPTKGKK